MRIIVGLGNPGQKFEKTRHNVGFWVLDEFKKKFQFPEFKIKSDFFSKITKKKIGKHNVILLKPQTFMNDSGKAVQAIIEKRKLNPKNLIVVHDDLDIPFGKIKISVGKSSAGHKGVQSIIEKIKNKDFIRVRVGINPECKQKIKIAEFVIEEFKEEEIKALPHIIELTVKAIETILEEGVEKAMNKFNSSSVNNLGNER